MINIKEHWRKAHSGQESYNISSDFWLTGTALKDYINYFNVKDKYNTSNNILEIGVGKLTATKKISKEKNLYVLDISEKAIENAKKYTNNGYTLDNIEKIPKNYFDLMFCFLVVQHIDDEMLNYHLKNLVPCLNKNGIYCIQYVLERDKNENTSEIMSQISGEVRRSQKHMENLIKKYNCKILEHKNFKQGSDHGGWTWTYIKFKKNDM